MRFGILGPLGVTESGQPVHVGGPKVRNLLAALLVHANEVVSADELGAVLWPSSPPDGLLNALQTQVSRLRASIDPVASGDRDADRRLARSSHGYRLRVGEGELDAMDFEAASQQARLSRAHGNAADAARLAGQALDLWRGRALDEYAHEPFARARATQLEEGRLLTIECRVDAGLVLGRHRELIGELYELVDQHPLSESLWSHLMVALYRAGRQSEALRVYERLRRHLADELGISPGVELVRLERAVLDQDPALDWRGEPPSPAGPVHLGSSAEVPDRDEKRGPVTFLFTDVEHSTILWDRDPTAMSEALEVHDAVVRHAIESHGGHIFARPGEGFYAVFNRAGDAIRAAVRAQRDLGGRDRSEPPRLHVRMAVHTGDAEQREGNYFGPPVNRTARMRDAGHGGQVLVSAATRELVVDWLPDEVGLTDIGTWLFEGFTRPERVYQIDHPDLSAGFPPLRSGRPRTGGLPRTSTSFVGRSAETERVTAALREHPLVVLVGEGGIGKTRLALELAHRTTLADYPDGLWFCDLSPLHDGDGVAEAVATALELPTSVGTDVRTQVVAHLQSAHLLLLLDNAERLRPAVAQLAEDVLASGSASKMLVTSRAPLRTTGEHIIQLDPLAVPGEADPQPTDAAAVRLLVDRARAADAPIDVEDPVLLDIARQLDGMPLAIELAAPRLATMSPRELVSRLDPRFELLTDAAGRPERQRTLRATIDWSFDLLSTEARLLFGALSVFRGGWTLDAAEAVGQAVGLEANAVAPLVADLADQSMIRVELPPQGVARYQMLETMRAYAAEHLGRIGLSGVAAQRHAEHFIDLAEQAARQRRGPLEPAWIGEIEIEFDNLRAAYRWAIESDRPASGLRLLASLSEDIMRDRLELGRWAEELAALPTAAAEPLRAIALGIAGHTAMIEFRADDALRQSREALEVERATGAPPSWIPRTTLALMMGLGFADGDYREQLRSLEEISETTGDPLPAAVADFDRCRMAALVGQPHKSLRAAERLLATGAESRNPTMLAMGLVSHGRAIAVSDPTLAAREYQDAVTVATSVHNIVLVQQALRALEELNALSGDRAAALASLRNVAASFEKSGNVTEQLQTVISMLDSLVALELWRPLATICGALAQTPWRLSPTSEVIERTVAEGLGDDGDYQAARAAGAAMTPSDLARYVSRVIREVIDDG